MSNYMKRQNSLRNGNIVENRKCLIIAAGPEKDLSYVTNFISRYHPYIFCADGGLHHLNQLGLQANWIIGDFDSAPKPFNPVSNLLCLPTDKEETDTQVCVKKAIELGFRDITLVCASGGRIDHFLCNLSVLEMAWEDAGAVCRLLNSQNEICYHPGGYYSYDLNQEYDYVSIIPLDEKLEDVTLKGLKYPLTHQTLYRHHMISISNETVASVFSIEIGKGKAFIIFSAK